MQHLISCDVNRLSDSLISSCPVAEIAQGVWFASQGTLLFGGAHIKSRIVPRVHMFLLKEFFLSIFLNYRHEAHKGSSGFGLYIWVIAGTLRTKLVY